MIARPVQQAPPVGAVAKARARMKDIVRDEGLAGAQPPAQDPLRAALGERPQALGGRADQRIVLPDHVARARRVAQAQPAALHPQHGPRAGPARGLRGLVRGDGHRVRRHQRLHQGRVLVAEVDVGQLVVHEQALAALGRRTHAVQHEGAHGALRGVVVAVGVPAQGTVAIGDVAAVRAARAHPQAGDGVLVGTGIAVQAPKPEQRGEGAQLLLGQRAWEAHQAGVGTGAGGAHGPEGRPRAPRVRHLDGERLQRARPGHKLAAAPLVVGFLVPGIEGARHGSRSRGPRCAGALPPHHRGAGRRAQGRPAGDARPIPKGIAALGPGTPSVGCSGARGRPRLSTATNRSATAPTPVSTFGPITVGRGTPTLRGGRVWRPVSLQPRIRGAARRAGAEKVR